MSEVLFWLAITNLVVALTIWVQLVRTGRAIRKLRDVPVGEVAGQWPLVSVIVPARNEERHVEAALQSLLNLDYPNLELTVVNDRSTDRTGEILERLAAAHPRLQIVHLTELPPGWLGKNYAMHRGAEHSHGSWLLFTDADVRFEPTVLRRAIPFALQQELQHLAIVAEVLMPTWLLEAFVVAFGIFFTMLMRLWKVRDPRSSAYIGVGTFNLVRTDVYRKLGGHQPLAMRPDDDIKLGKLLKKNGYRQDLLGGADLLRVPWYNSLGELIVGLEKNTFAGVEYSVSVTVGATAGMLLFFVWPFGAFLVTSGASQMLYLAVAGLEWWLCWNMAASMKLRRSCAFGFPLVVLLFVYIIWRSMWLTLKNRGIRWRDTHYPLAELRANKV